MREKKRLKIGNCLLQCLNEGKKKTKAKCKKERLRRMKKGKGHTLFKKKLENEEIIRI